LNERAFEIAERIAEELGKEFINYKFNGRSVKILDLGVEDDKILDSDGIYGIGERVAEITMGSLGSVSVRDDEVYVEIGKYPAIATLSCQLAGWGIDIKGRIALGSGPARILARKPRSIIDRISYYEESDVGVLVLETENLPDNAVCGEILRNSGVSELVIVAFSGNSIIGLINIMARIVEVGILRLDRLGYNVNKILYASGNVPIPNQSNEIMFESNDMIIYKGEVFLRVEEWQAGLEKKAISRASRFYGRKFKDIFYEADGDFYKIDPEIFAPARLIVNDLSSGRTFESG